MSDNSYIKIFRKIKKWGWYQDANTFRVFVHLLLNANWSESEYRGETLYPGDVVFGRKKYAQDLKLSEQQVRTALEHLLKSGEISTIKATNRFSIIHIEKWTIYQGAENESNQRRNQKITNKQPTDNHIQKEKERKEEKEYIKAGKGGAFKWEVETVIQYLNDKSGKNFRPATRTNAEYISALLEEGYSINDLKEVIDKKVKEWSDDPKMNEWLCPKTLFRPENFERYLNAGRKKPKKKQEAKEWIVFKDEDGNEFAL